ncbi:MAG: type III-B CRISPR module RAMP protein Cmr4 [Acidobacteria bacterium]|nr:type III-B CRISPR module RAMP protein Cmr4 [Acidobacteriota bacterium]
MAHSTRVYWLHALTPLHVGEGFGIGAIDLPIMRERTTKWPLVPGSSIKGVISDRFGASEKDAREEKDKDENGKNHARELAAAFGKGGDEFSNSGALVFTDSRIVALPVHSDYGTFAWVTSKRVLMRLKRDLDEAGLGTGLTAEIAVEDNSLQVPGPDSALKSSDSRAYLGDLDFAVKPGDPAKQWAEKLAGWIFADETWRKEFIKRFAIVPDSTFDFFAQNGTEIAARIRIKAETKTVDSTGFWYEESLPAETILAGLVWCDRVFVRNRSDYTGQQLLDRYCKEELLLQVGGKATIGKGRARCIFGGSNG